MLAGCASIPCTLKTIVVAKKDARVRLERIVSGLRTTPFDRVEEVRTEIPVREYWVQAQDGSWHRLLAAEFKAAQVDKPLEICR